MPRVLDVYDTIGLTLASNDDLIVGRTTIQKLIYFETVKIPEIRIEPYTAYFYGPFNRQVAEALEFMVVSDILEEKKVRSFNSGYQYKVTDKGRPIIQNLTKKLESSYFKIEEIVTNCNEFCQLRSNPLSFAAKVHYMLRSTRNKKGISLTEAKDIGKTLGWDISKSEIEEGAQLLEYLNLVKIQK